MGSAVTFYALVAAIFFAGLYWALGAKTVRGRVGRIILVIALIELPIAYLGVFLLITNTTA